MIQRDFVMREPNHEVTDWHFVLWCTEHAAREMVKALDCISSYHEFGNNERIDFWISPRYDHEEVWLSIYLLLEEHFAPALDQTVWGDWGDTPPGASPAPSPDGLA